MKKIRLGVLFLLFLCMLCYGGYFIMEKSKIGSHPIDNLDVLLIGIGDFPPEWSFEYKIPITGDYDYGEKNINIAFSRKSESGFAHQYVYHFRNSLAASFSYFFLKVDLPIVKHNSMNFTNYNSPMADDWYMACKQPNHNTGVCDILSRYDDFIIYFSISFKIDQFTPEQLTAIFESIDERMKTVLER